MKNFNIELAKAGHPVCTRDGRKARIISYDFNTCDPEDLYPIVAIVRGADEEYLVTYTREGRELANGEMKKDDLFLAPAHHEGWVNLLRKEDGTYDIYSELFDHPVVALTAGESMGNTYVKSIKIEWDD